MLKKAIILLVLACAGCSDDSHTASKPDPTAVFSLRTECGKMGEAWLMRHPLETGPTISHGAANVFYSSSANRCWIVVAYTNWHYSRYLSHSPRLWPHWASHDIWENVTEQKQYLYDAQTGARVMMCRVLDYKDGYDDDCRYIRKVDASDL